MGLKIIKTRSKTETKISQEIEKGTEWTNKARKGESISQISKSRKKEKKEKKKEWKKEQREKINQL